MALDIEDDDVEVRRGRLRRSSREKELLESRNELLKMFDELEAARTEAKRARLEASVLRERVVKNPPKKFQFRTVAAAFTAALLTAAVMKIAYVGYTRPAPVQHPVLEKAPTPESNARVQPPAPKEEEFNQAISRLQEDFDSLPESQSQIVAQVNAKYPGHEPCPLQWPNGNAALFLMMQKGHSSSLMQNINQCADAIEKLYDEREAAILRQSQAAK